MSDTRMEDQQPLIAPEAVEALRARIGRTMSVQGEPYLTEVTRDAARHWSDATGDRNPLWRDDGYARSWGYDRALCPPTMLYGFSKLSIGYRGGLPGVHSFFGGTNWHWLRPIPHGTRIDVEVVFKDLIEHKSTFAEVSYRQLSDVLYRSSEGESLAEAEAWGMRTSRRKAQERKTYGDVHVATYTAEEIEAIADRYEAEVVRTEPLDASGVAPGDALPEIVRGPYTVTTAVAFEQAWGGLFVRAHGNWFDFARKHPAAALRNDLGIPEPPEAVHWDRDFARKAGVPEPYDYGPERLAWLSVLVTNWMGPLGFLRRLNVQIRRFNLVGDLTACTGTVTDVAREGDRTIVSIEVQAQNQRAERTAFGTAEVELAAR